MQVIYVNTEICQIVDCIRNTKRYYIPTKRKTFFAKTNGTLNNWMSIFKIWLLKMLQMPAENSKFAFTLNLLNFNPQSSKTFGIESRWNSNQFWDLESHY